MTTRLNRDDRIRVYEAGGFMNSLMGTPVDITLNKIPDDAFKEVTQIIRLLTTSEDELTPEEVARKNQTRNFVGDFGHYIAVGNHDDQQNKLRPIFMGHYQPTPLIVTELEATLKEHATPEDLKLKP